MHDDLFKKLTVDQMAGASAIMNVKEQPDVKNQILIMDDDRVVRMVAQQLFGKAGYSSDCVSTGDEAIEMYKAALISGRPYQMVLVDLNISDGMGGIETVKIIRSLDSTAKVILFSGLGNDPITNDYRRYGFDEILKKPFSFDECLKLIENLNS